MKIHEYNEMMAYLTRPAMIYGGRIGFNEGKLVETAKNKFVQLESGSTVDLSNFLDELGVEGKPARTRVGLRIKRLLAKEFPELKLLGAVEKLQAQETKLINFLQDRINKGETRFNGGLEEIKKLANVELKVTQLSKVMRANFPKTFIYRGIDMDQLPDALINEIIKLGKIENAATITKQLKDKLPFQAGKKLETTLVNNILDRAVDEGLLEKKFERRGGSALSVTETTRRDNLIKDFIDRNPDMDNAHAIAKGVNAENPDLNLSGHYVYDDKTNTGAMKRLGLEEIMKTRHAKIFPEVKALDKIIKQNMDLINSNMSPEAIKNELVKAYAKETNKSLVQAESELVSRMRKLGKLYAGTEQRYEKELYNQIKIPKNYIGSKFQQIFIAVTDRAGKVSNINMAELLGLPKSEIKLIQGTANMMNAFDFKVAGDHTDIKAMMKDFPNYRKNFTRIEYVKDSLNEFKRSYDKKINNLRKKAQGTLDPVLQKKYLEQAEALAAEFRNKTGYRIGTFGLDFSKSNTGLGRVTINPQTLRLPDLKNPYNKTLQTAMKNFETTGTPTDKNVIKFTGVDKELMESNATNREEIFNRIQGTEEAKNSKYLKALQKVPKIGKIATAVIGGTAGAAAISTLANANEPGQMPQGSPKQLSEEEKDTGIPYEAGAATAAALGKYGPQIWKGAKAVGKGILKPVMSPAMGAGLAVDELVEDIFPIKFAEEGEKNLLGLTYDEKFGTLNKDASVSLAGSALLWPDIMKRLGSKVTTTKKFYDTVLRMGVAPKLVPHLIKGMTGAGLIMIGGDIVQGLDKRIGLEQRGPITEEEYKEFESKRTSMPRMLDTYEQVSKIAKEQNISYEDALKQVQKPDIPGINYNQGGRVGYRIGGLIKLYETAKKVYPLLKSGAKEELAKLFNILNKNTITVKRGESGTTGASGEGFTEYKGRYFNPPEGGFEGAAADARFYSKLGGPEGKPKVLTAELTPEEIIEGKRLRGLDVDDPEIGDIILPESAENKVKIDYLNTIRARIEKILGMAEGGRVGFDKGSKPKNPGRRAFIKGVTALAALPLVGRFFKIGEVLQSAKPYLGPTIDKVKGMPEWFPGLVKKLFNEGEDVTEQAAFKERQIVKRGTLEGGDDVDMIYDLDTGNVNINVTPKKGTYQTSSGAYNKEYSLEYTKGQADEMTKGKPPDEFEVAELEGRADPNAMDIDWEGKMTTVDDAMSDLTELEAFAKNKTTTQIHKKKGTKPKDVFPDYDYDPLDDY